MTLSLDPQSLPVAMDSRTCQSCGEGPVACCVLSPTCPEFNISEATAKLVRWVGRGWERGEYPLAEQPKAETLRVKMSF